MLNIQLEIVAAKIKSILPSDRHLGEHWLLLEDGEDSEGLLDQVYAGLKVQAKVDEGPGDPFNGVLWISDVLPVSFRTLYCAFG